MKRESRSPQASTAQKQKKASNGCGYCLGSFIGLVLIVFGLTAVNLHQFVYHYKYHELIGPGEFSLHHVAHDINTILCRAYEVTPFLPANVFLIEGKAKVNHHRRVIVKRKTDQLVPSSIRLNNHFYLLEGSTIHVNGCKDIQPFYDDDAAQILIFKGEKSWRSWLEGKCGDCPVDKVDILRDDYCGASNARLTYKVEARDTYYVALSKEDDVFSGFEADATIRRTTFELKHVKERCHMTNECYLNLTYGKEMDVVVQFPDSMTISSLGAECKYRTMFWYGIFAIFPGCLIGLALCCCCCCVCGGGGKKREKKRSYTEQATSPLTGSSADMLKNEFPPDYKSIGQDGNVQYA